MPLTISIAKDGELLTANEMGDIHGHVSTGQRIILKNVLYVPNLRENLISVSKMSKAGLEVVFKKNTATILNKGKELAIAEPRGNVFELKFIKCINCSYLCSNDEGRLWHCRLGHINQKVLESMNRKEMVTGMGNVKCFGLCDVCLKGKQCREPLCISIVLVSWKEFTAMYVGLYLQKLMMVTNIMFHSLMISPILELSI